ncbi:MAG: lytic transglycosylase [Methylobacter sp.]|nr:MAG: lytic transglycosylase [Methylobacter sp.]
MRYFLLLFIIFPLYGYAGSAVLKQSLWAKASQLAGVPPNTLYGIALQETGMRWHDGTFRPWPWTIFVNKGGAGIKSGPYRYPTKAAAVNALTDMLDQGVTNIDVGLMQINLYWNGHRVRDKRLLMEPGVNIMVAAGILKDVHVGNSLRQAVARYHSFNAGRGAAYSTKVKLYETILDEKIE